MWAYKSWLSHSSHSIKPVNCTHQCGKCHRQWQFWAAGVLPLGINTFIYYKVCRYFNLQYENTLRYSQKFVTTGKSRCYHHQASSHSKRKTPKLSQKSTIETLNIFHKTVKSLQEMILLMQPPLWIIFTKLSPYLSKLKFLHLCQETIYLKHSSFVNFLMVTLVPLKKLAHMAEMFLHYHW